MSVMQILRTVQRTQEELRSPCNYFWKSGKVINGGCEIEPRVFDRNFHTEFLDLHSLQLDKALSNYKNATRD